MAAQFEDVLDSVLEPVLDEVQSKYAPPDFTALDKGKVVDTVLDDVDAQYDDDEHKGDAPSVGRARGSLQTIKFQLTTKQRNALIGDVESAKALMSDLTNKIAPCTIAVCGREKDMLQLVVQVSADFKAKYGRDQIEWKMTQNRNNAVQQLETKLGVLLSDDEIAQIRKKTANHHNRIFDGMKEMLRNGVMCFHDYANGQSRKTFLTIPEPSPCDDQQNCYRLYWKDNQEDAPEEKKSVHLSEIDKVTMGKGQNTADDAEVRFCFSVVTKKETRDYQSHSSIKVVAYLRALCTHYKETRDKGY